jgi:hypothetical protein
MTVGRLLKHAQKGDVIFFWCDKCEKKVFVFEAVMIKHMHRKGACENDSEGLHDMEDLPHVLFLLKDPEQGVVDTTVNDLLDDIAQMLIDMRDDDKLRKGEIASDLLDNIMAEKIHKHIISGAASINTPRTFVFVFSSNAF